MIHNSSSDPVLIKKISLKIWSLRDEIESRIQAKIDAGELLPESMEEKIKELRDEYTKKMALPDNVVQLKSGDDLPADGEDEMAKAMAAAMENPESEEASAEEGADNVVSMNGESPAPATTVDGNVITIGIEAPVNLSDDKISKGKTILS